MSFAFSYQRNAQVEFDLILDFGGSSLRRCLALAVARHDLIADGTKPLRRPWEFVAPGRSRASLFMVEYTTSLVNWVNFVYEQVDREVAVLAIDAWRRAIPFGSRVGADAYQRALPLSR